MKLIPIIIGALYDHFYKMKEKGRKVVPWLQTTFVCSMELTFLIFLLGKNIAQNWRTAPSGNINEPVLLIFILGTWTFLFFLIKMRYFDTEKFIGYYSSFIQLPDKKRRTYKILVIGSFIVVPFLLGYKVWYDAK